MAVWIPDVVRRGSLEFGAAWIDGGSKCDSGAELVVERAFGLWCNSERRWVRGWSFSVACGYHDYFGRVHLALHYPAHSDHRVMVHRHGYLLVGAVAAAAAYLVRAGIRWWFYK